MAEFNRTRGRRLSLTVNVSAENLVDVTLPGTVSEVLAESGLAPDLLWIEITEHAVLQRHAEVRADHRGGGETLASDAMLSDQMPSLPRCLHVTR